MPVLLPLPPPYSPRRLQRLWPASSDCFAVNISVALDSRRLLFLTLDSIDWSKCSVSLTCHAILISMCFPSLSSITRLAFAEWQKSRPCHRRFRPSGSFSRVNPDSAGRLQNSLSSIFSVHYHQHELLTRKMVGRERPLVSIVNNGLGAPKIPGWQIQ